MGSRVTYTPEFRERAVRLVTDTSRSMIDVAAQIDVSYDTIRTWVNRAKHMDEAKFESNNENDEREMKRLQRRISELEMENAFLKKAAAFFAAEQNPKSGSR